MNSLVALSPPSKFSNSDDIFRNRVTNTSNGTHHSAVTQSLRSSAHRYPTSEETNGAPGCIFKTNSMGQVDNGSFEVNRTRSGGLFMRKKRNQEEIIQAKANAMCEVFELSDVRDTELNKNAIVKHKALGFSGAHSLKTISVKQAAEAFRIGEQIKKDKHFEPLSTEKENRAEKRLEEQKPRKKEAMRYGHSAALQHRVPLSHVPKNSVSKCGDRYAVVDMPSHHTINLFDLPTFC